MSDFRRNSCQLSKHVEPIHYDLRLDFNPDQTVFRGNVTIDILVTDGQRGILLNSVDLEIEEILLNNEQCIFSIDRVKPILRIIPGGNIPRETYKLNIKYSGRFRADGLGLICHVTGKGKESNNIVVWNNNEPKSARRVFPCFDDPSYLTTFQLTVTTLQSFTVISNMSIYERRRSQGYLTTVFENITKKVTTMSPSFVAGEFLHDASPFTDSVQIRIYRQKRAQNLSSEHALNVARKMIELYGNSFKPYPLRKLDIVALPTSTTHSTYGIILMPKEKLLINPAQSSERRRKLVALSLCNAMAYQWFESIVQHIWKANNWLHDAIALWCQYFGADDFDSNWEMWNDFFVDVHLKALKYDDRRVCGPLETESNVNVAKYKGACLIQMLYHWMGKERFLQGVRIYLNGYRCLLTDSIDFYVALKNATNADLDVGRIMAVWGSQRGYPLIKVIVEPPQRLRFKQKSCLKNSNEKDEWPIPVHLAVINNPNSETIRREEMRSKELVINSENPVCQNLRPNPFRKSFYRIYYGGQDIAQNIVMNLRNYSLEDRIAHQDDWFAAMISGRKSHVNDHDSVLRAYANGERSYLVWRSLMKNFKLVNLIVEMLEVEYVDRFQLVLKAILLPNYQRLKRKQRSEWTNNDYLLYQLLYKRLTVLEHPEVRERALDTFQRCIKYGDDMEKPDLAGCYSAVAKYGVDYDMDCLIVLLEAEKSSSKRYQIIKTLGESNPSRLKQILTRMLLLPSKYNMNELIYLLKNSSKSRKTIKIAWEFVTTNYDQLLALSSSSQLHEMFKVVTRHMTKKFYVQYFFVKDFLVSKSDNIPVRIRKEIMSSLRRNSEHYNNGHGAVQRWIENIQGLHHVTQTN